MPPSSPGPSSSNPSSRPCSRGSSSPRSRASRPSWAARWCSRASTCSCAATGPGRRRKHRSSRWLRGPTGGLLQLQLADGGWVTLRNEENDLYLDPEVDRALARRAAAEGITKAKLVRRVLAAAVSERPRARGVFEGPRDLGAGAERY